MTFIQNILRKIEYGKYVPVEKYGVIYTDRIGREEFTLIPQLLKGEADWALRLDIRRRWGSTGDSILIDCHFRDLDEIRIPFQRLLSDVQSGVTQPNTALDAGVVMKRLMTLAAGEVIRSYGRIDHHPSDEVRFRLELFLSWDGEQYWMILCQGQSSVEWSKWSIGIAQAINDLFPRIGGKMRELRSWG